MPRKLYSEDQGGITETWLYDDATDTVGVRHEQDSQAALDYVHAKHIAGGGKGEEFWHVAETPIVVARDWAIGRGICPDQFIAGQYPDEWMKMIREMPKLSPTGGKM